MQRYLIFDAIRHPAAGSHNIYRVYLKLGSTLLIFRENKSMFKAFLGKTCLSFHTVTHV